MQLISNSQDPLAGLSADSGFRLKGKRHGRHGDTRFAGNVFNRDSLPGRVCPAAAMSFVNNRHSLIHLFCLFFDPQTGFHRPFKYNVKHYMSLADRLFFVNQAKTAHFEYPPVPTKLVAAMITCL